MDFILNEESLKGQFDSIQSFLESLDSNVKCFKLIHKNCENNIYKTSDFYKCYITRDKQISDLKAEPCNDSLMRFQIQLDEEIRTAPYWDEDPEHDISKAYYWNGEDISATSIAEAARRNVPLLSFKSELFTDCRLDVSFESEEYSIASIYSPQYLAGHFSKELSLDGDDLLKIRYEGTLIDCTFLEKKYGSSILEKNEYCSLLSSLDKFIQLSWNDIEKDDGLEYKKYKPSSKENWFRNSPFCQQTIMKFRFSDVLRAYGYRHDNRFRLLRLERDHKKSDKG
ncbi:MAG: hypothetical protein NC341_04405 [Blautia sp.]|nr:hypothetical protein [Blautia sp.]MCM1200878.1 hypothetical protein [Bacteroides fragilis]